MHASCTRGQSESCETHTSGFCAAFKQKLSECGRVFVLSPALIPFALASFSLCTLSGNVEKLEAALAVCFGRGEPGRWRAWAPEAGGGEPRGGPGPWQSLQPHVRMPGNTISWPREAPLLVLGPGGAVGQALTHQQPADCLMAPDQGSCGAVL